MARSLEMSHKTLSNWVAKARKGQPLVKRSAALPVDEVQAELARLRQEVVTLRTEKEILKSRSVHCAGVAVKYAWIESQRGSYNVMMMCRLLDVMLPSVVRSQPLRRQRNVRPDRLEDSAGPLVVEQPDSRTPCRAPDLVEAEQDEISPDRSKVRPLGLEVMHPCRLDKLAATSAVLMVLPWYLEASSWYRRKTRARAGT